MHDIDRAWTVHLQDIPKRAIAVCIDKPYRSDDLEVVETTIRHYISTVYPSPRRP